MKTTRISKKVSSLPPPPSGMNFPNVYGVKPLEPKKDKIYTKKELEKMYGEKGISEMGSCPKCGTDMHMYGRFLHCLHCGYWEGEDYAHDRLMSEGKI